MGAQPPLRHRPDRQLQRPELAAIPPQFKVGRNCCCVCVAATRASRRINARRVDATEKGRREEELRNKPGVGPPASGAPSWGWGRSPHLEVHVRESRPVPARNDGAKGDRPVGAGEEGAAEKVTAGGVDAFVEHTAVSVGCNGGERRLGRNGEGEDVKNGAPAG